MIGPVDRWNIFDSTEFRIDGRNVRPNKINLQALHNLADGPWQRVQASGSGLFENGLSLVAIKNKLFFE